MATGNFATAINCIDGRTVRPVVDWLAQHLNVDYIDLITEPGPEKMLTQGTAEQIDDIKRKVLVSVRAHHSQTVALVAHYDCAGNPVTEDEHKAQVLRGCHALQALGLGVRVLGLWVNDAWQVEVGCDLPAPTP